MRVLGDDEIRDRLDALDGPALAATAFSALAGGGASGPAALHLDVPGGELHVKAGGVDALAVKVNLAMFDNPSAGRPMIQGAIVAFDLATGAPVAVLASGALTGWRTAAASLAALEAVDGSVPEVLVVGAGAQARHHVTLLRRARPEVVVRVVARREVATLGDVEMVPPEGLVDAVATHRTIITLTPARSPLFPDVVSDGTTIVAAGADSPGKQELPVELVARARVVADTLEQSRRLGELQHVVGAPAGGITTVGAVLTGREPARTEPDQVVVVDLTGTAIHDAVVVGAVLEELES